MCALTECNSTMFCIWPDDGSMSRNMSQNFLYCLSIYVVFIDRLNYYIIAKYNGMAPIKENVHFSCSWVRTRF